MAVIFARYARYSPRLLWPWEDAFPTRFAFILGARQVRGFCSESDPTTADATSRISSFDVLSVCRKNASSVQNGVIVVRGFSTFNHSTLGYSDSKLRFVVNRELSDSDYQEVSVSGKELLNHRCKSLGWNKYDSRGFCSDSSKLEQSKHKNAQNDRDTVPSNKTKSGPLRKLLAMANAFWIGCKQLLWTDAKQAYATRKKLKHNNYDLTILTREELRHMRQTQKDFIKSLPVALLFFVPFIGYLAPVIGYIFPKRLLSEQFWDLEQKKKFAFEDHVERSQYYLPLTKEVGWSSRELKDEDLFQMCIRVIDGEHPHNADLISNKDVFSKDLLSIEGMTRYHLVKLSKTWLLPAKWYIPRKALREYLVYRVKHVLDDDMLIRKDGIDALTDKCVKQACQARGLDKSAFKPETLRNWLADWIDLTSLVSSANDLSFVAHCAVFKSINFGRNVSEDEIMTTSEEGSQIYAGKEHELIESYKKNETS